MEGGRGGKAWTRLLCSQFGSRHLESSLLQKYRAMTKRKIADPSDLFDVAGDPDSPTIPSFPSAADDHLLGAAQAMNQPGAESSFGTMLPDSAYAQQAYAQQQAFSEGHVERSAADPVPLTAELDTFDGGKLVGPPDGGTGSASSASAGGAGTPSHGTGLGKLDHTLAKPKTCRASVRLQVIWTKPSGIESPR